MRLSGGYSLIEIVIACFISSILFAGVMQIYLAVSHSYKREHALLALQQTGAFVITTINQAVHKSRSVIAAQDNALNLGSERYYVKHSALYMKKSAGKRGVELVAGISNFKLKYGVSREGHFDYLTAQQVTDWQDIRSVDYSFYLTVDEIKKQWFGYAELRNGSRVSR